MGEVVPLPAKPASCIEDARVGQIGPVSPEEAVRSVLALGGLVTMEAVEIFIRLLRTAGFEITPIKQGD